MTDLLYKTFTRSANVVVATLCLSSSILASQVAQAGNMYIYKDDTGQVLLTNVNPSGNFGKYSKKVKVSYYPNSGAEQDAQRTVLPALSSPDYSDFDVPFDVPTTTVAGNNMYDHYIIDSATRHGVDPALLKAMMHTESAFNPNARSPVGAQGLMQLMPATARRFSVRNAWNPAENIEGAAKYVAWLSKRFNGNIEHVLAGYNAGEGNVDKYGGIPPFTETRNYVKKVLNRYNTLYKNDSALFSARNVTNSNNDDNIQHVSFATSSNGYSQAAFSALR